MLHVFIRLQVVRVNYFYLLMVVLHPDGGLRCMDLCDKAFSNQAEFISEGSTIGVMIIFGVPLLVSDPIKDLEIAGKQLIKTQT